MEDALGGPNAVLRVPQARQRVLILVLMEDALGGAKDLISLFMGVLSM